MTVPSAGTRRTATSAGGPSPRILLLGSTGFVGSRVAASLLAAGAGRLVTLSRNAPEPPPSPHATTLRGDLRDPEAVHRALDGVDVVIHAASYVGRDARLARETNEEGTRNLLDQCRRRGLDRVIYLSTTSVYGAGPHRGLAEDQAAYAPESVASATRATADRATLEHGGTVVRPNLVFGAGDRWFIPGLAKLMRVGVWPGDGTARLSLIDVDALGLLVADLALGAAQPGRAFHAAADPVPVHDLLRAASKGLSIPAPRFEPDREAALPAALETGFSRHQVELVSADHWYSTAALQAALGGTVQGSSLPDDAQWNAYREALS